MKLCQNSSCMAEQVSLQRGSTIWALCLFHSYDHATKGIITSSSLSAFRAQNVVKVQLLASYTIRLAFCICVVADICLPEHNHKSSKSRVAQVSALGGCFLIQVLTVLGKFIQPRHLRTLLHSIGC